MELTVTDITKKFQDITAVDQVSCRMTEGVYGLLGVNGAGKTTFMRMLCTLLRPTGGTITWEGEDIFSMDGRYRKILGYLPQEFGFYPDFSVRDYLMYVASIKGLRPVTAGRRTGELLELAGLSGAEKKKMKKLSGGMKRRVGIAQAMLNDPKILILDEPTAGLDPNERIRFRNLISELAEKRLILLSTHIVSDVEYIAHEILLMCDGKIRALGTTEELIDAMPTRVWRVPVPKDQVDFFMKNYKTANIKTARDGAELRILSEQRPTEEALEETATLEDLFLHYFGEKAGGENADL